MVRKQATATEGSVITVTAQQSRFHTDAEDTPSAAREVSQTSLENAIFDLLKSPGRLSSKISASPSVIENCLATQI